MVDIHFECFKHSIRWCIVAHRKSFSTPPTNKYVEQHLIPTARIQPDLSSAQHHIICETQVNLSDQRIEETHIDFHS